MCIRDRCNEGELLEKFNIQLSPIPMPELTAEMKKVKEDVYKRQYHTFLHVLMDENPESCIIFCGTREMVNVLFQKLRRNRIFCGMLHGDMEQKERLKLSLIHI